jgi:Methyltransferase domain
VLTGGPPDETGSIGTEEGSPGMAGTQGNRELARTQGERPCPACLASHEEPAGEDSWFLCRTCRTYFRSEPLPQPLGGENEEARSDDRLHAERLRRLRIATRNDPWPLLDFGCGHGSFFRYCNRVGRSGGRFGAIRALLRESGKQNGARQLAYGYDPYGPPEVAGPLHEREVQTYSSIVAIEVIEHLPTPDEQLRTIASVLRKNGVVMVEGTFGATPQSEYGRAVGHMLLLNPETLQLLFERHGLGFDTRVNANVFIFRKG